MTFCLHIRLLGAITLLCIICCDDWLNALLLVWYGIPTRELYPLPHEVCSP